MTGGTEWIVDAHGCDAARLRDPDTLRRLCEGVIAALALTVIGQPQLHRFGGPGGVTALFLLAEALGATRVTVTTVARGGGP